MPQAWNPLRQEAAAEAEGFVWKSMNSVKLTIIMAVMEAEIGESIGADRVEAPPGAPMREATIMAGEAPITVVAIEGTVVETGPIVDRVAPVEEAREPEVEFAIIAKPLTLDHFLSLSISLYIPISFPILITISIPLSSPFLPTSRVRSSFYWNYSNYCLSISIAVQGGKAMKRRTNNVISKYAVRHRNFMLCFHYARPHSSSLTRGEGGPPYNN